MRNVSDKICREYQSTHSVISNLFENTQFTRKFGKYFAEQHGACSSHTGYLRLQTHTIRLCNIRCFSTAIIAERTPLNVMLHLNCFCCWVWEKSFSFEFNVRSDGLQNHCGFCGMQTYFLPLMGINPRFVYVPRRS
jgi:hypothetical protein